MRIEELVLEGFKSYPVRTQITGWDASFNAITGLNGSGKSNILDAICFVLGITNMSQMRAQNQQDLIYKRGQAGVTKASVTIVFDNSDREKSPVGYEMYSQITVTRQIALPNVTKYLVNGHKAQQNAVHSLFQSVQLNINNPNFLIMQGRITKVLNMRPQEILSMVEEAAGTRMFEDRKDKAKKTMAKKDKRVQEINSLLAEEITPKLDKLREEKRIFLQWQKGAAELERLGRTLCAFEWFDAHQRIEDADELVANKGAEIEENKKRKKRLLKECQAAEAQREEVNTRREKERKKGGKLKKMEEDVAEMEKELEKVRTQVDIRTNDIADEEKKVGEKRTELDELGEALKQKTSQVEECERAYQKVKEQQEAEQTKFNNSEELLQTLLTGLSSSATNTGGGYMGQLADARQRGAAAAGEVEQIRTKMAMREKELSGLEGRWRDVEREAGQSKMQLESKRGELEKARRTIAACGWSSELETKLEADMRAAKENMHELNRERDMRAQSLPSLNFEYSTPHPNFDRRKVKGLVAKLISIPQQHHSKATALEVAAGPRLYNVVVEDERVGKDLLQNGRLKKRVTIIPLNKINAFTLSAQKLNEAKRLAPGKANLALSLVGYPEEVSKAMAYVFGDTIVCEDPESAKAVTFGAKVKSVTLEGDVYDPSGTLSGGSAPTGNGVLVKVQGLIEAERQLQEAKEALAGLDKEAEKNKGRRDQWRALARDLEMKEHEVGLLEQQVGGSNATRINAEVEVLRKTIADLQTAVEAAQEKQKEAARDCKKLEKDMAEFKNNKEGKIDELKKTINSQKAALQKHAITVKTHQKGAQTARLEYEQIEGDIAAAQKAIASLEAAIAKERKELEKLKEMHGKIKAKHVEAEEKLQAERATLIQFDNELKALEETITTKKANVSQTDLDLKKLEHELVGLEKEKVTAENKVSNLEKANPWIVDGKHLFGRDGSQYDFARVPIDELRTIAGNLEAQQQKMKKKVNQKVMNVIDTVEKKETELKKMLNTVMKDKEKIEGTIEELDRYKRDALTKTWEKVSGDFGDIFAELLPGNYAKLRPPEGQDLMQGLEVKVRLGTVWKQSLTELSGGQRSLIALSLIMALLQFKPAPMYILDEIDAALDLSHTQHIGQLFRTRFKGSQFIVVSLKEGLFTNANVLFRARFRDGTSIVERTAQRSTSALYANGRGDQDGEDEGRGGRRRRTGA